MGLHGLPRSREGTGRRRDVAGNVSSFLDIFIEYDLAHGNIDEVFAQELIDQFVIKLRMVRHLRMQSYNDIFAGDPRG